MTDSKLLRRYVQGGDETAFADLVRRYVDLVYSAALRLAGGDAALAQDVSQSVFTDLARKAWTLSGRDTISGWLHTSTRYAALKALRGEGRRRAREQEAFIMQDNPTMPEINWEQLRPTLDEAVGQLRARDRDIVTLRFFQNKSHREIGAELGLNEDTARKRVDRALEKLRAHFARRGITVSSMLLAAAITTNSVHAAPVGLAARLSGTALASAGGAGVAGSFLKILTMTTKTKTTLTAAVVIIVAAFPLFLQHREIMQLREQLAAIQQGRPRSSRGQNRVAGRAGDASHQLTLAEIQAKIKALRRGGRNWRSQWQAFIDSLDPADISKVIACLDQELPQFTRRASFLMPLLAFWAKSDPQVALAYIEKSTPESWHELEAGAVLEGWAATNPEAAAAWWQQLPAGRMRVETTKTIIDALAEKNPQVAYELTMGADSQLQAGLIQDVFLSWAQADPAAAVAQASQMKLGQLRYLAFRDLAMGWTERDPQAALAWADSLPGGADKAIAVSMAVQGMVGANPEQARAYVLNLPPGQERDQSIEGLANILAQDAPNAAWALVQQLPDGKDKQNAQNAVINTWALSDPKGAMAFVESLPAESMQGLLRNIASNWAQNAPKDAIAEAGNLPEGPGRDAYLSGVFNGLLSSSPQDAANLVSSLPVNKQAVAADQVTFSLAQYVNPSAAAAWMATLPEGVTSAKAFDYVVSSWARYDPAAAGQWIQALPAGASQDTAIQSYVSIVAKSYPATAASWAVAIGDENRRNAAIEKVAQSWLGVDPKAAAAWLAQSGLPADRQQKLLNPSRGN